MKLKKIFMAVVVMVIANFVSYDLQAANPKDYAHDDLPIVRKLARGITNVGIGALEIPMAIIDTNEEEGGFAAVFYGTLKGLCWCIAREVVGVVEIITFPIPLPGATGDEHIDEWGYGPIMTPEWVVDEEHDWWNFIYPDYPPK